MSVRVMVMALRMVCPGLHCKAEQGRRLALQLQAPTSCGCHLQRDRHLQCASSIIARSSGANTLWEHFMIQLTLLCTRLVRLLGVGCIADAMKGSKGQLSGERQTHVGCRPQTRQKGTDAYCGMLKWATSCSLGGPRPCQQMWAQCGRGERCLLPCGN